MKTPVTTIFPRVGRVIPNAPLGHDSQTGVKLPVTPNRRVRDNAPYRDPRAAFTLIEMIGVMAVMAILATILVPNVLKSIERAALRAEDQNLANLGEQMKLFLRSSGAVISPNNPPANPNWTTDLAQQSALNPAQILTNDRQMVRLYVPEVLPPAIPQRALLISSMRSGQTLPTTAVIRLNFSNIWDWTEGSGVTPAGFAASWAPYLEYLKIERVNYRADLASRTVDFANQSAANDVEVEILNANGTRRELISLPRKATSAAPAVSQSRTVNNRERVILKTLPGSVIAHSIIGISENRTFEFSDTFGWKTL